jgi:protein tyrosine phosphatase (PTP) superfamily phosphohydrolase (DUF442 family)
VLRHISTDAPKPEKARASKQQKVIEMRTAVCSRALVLAGLLCFALGCPVLLDNFRAVEPGKFYRAAQMEAPVLARILDRYGIAIVINLRGTDDSEAWYLDELEVCRNAGVDHYDLRWSKNRLPKPESLAQFVDICENADGPILTHCQAGVDRTGAASAFYVLLRGGTIEEARRQFGVLYFDSYVGHVVDLYEGSTLSFAEWVRTVYPGIYATVPTSDPDKNAEES